jgi:3-oxoacyl-[acyl-carrier protein] reductase
VSHASLEELCREPVELTDRSREAGAADGPVEREARSLAGRLERVAVPERGWPAESFQGDVPIGDASGVAEVDALDGRAVVEHADAVAADAGGIDIALNAVSFPHVQGTPFAELAVEEVMHPIDAFLWTNAITSMAVARHMAARRWGTILTLSTAGSRVAPSGSLGYGSTCAAIEAMTQWLAVELGASGVRVACLRPPTIADAQISTFSSRPGAGWRPLGTID